MAEAEKKSNWIIRDYQAEDFAAINDLWQETGLASALRGDGPDIIMRTMRQGGRFLVIVESNLGVIVGTSWLTTDGRRLYLHHFGIKPAYQGQGLAKMLLRASLRVAKEKGLQVKLEVQRENSPAIALYRQFGFASLGDYQVFILRDLSGIT